MANQYTPRYEFPYQFGVGDQMGTLLWDDWMLNLEDVIYNAGRDSVVFKTGTAAVVGLQAGATQIVKISHDAVAIPLGLLVSLDVDETVAIARVCQMSLSDVVLEIVNVGSYETDVTVTVTRYGWTGEGPSSSAE